MLINHSSDVRGSPGLILSSREQSENPSSIFSAADEPTGTFPASLTEHANFQYMPNTLRQHPPSAASFPVPGTMSPSPSYGRDMPMHSMGDLFDPLAAAHPTMSHPPNMTPNSDESIPFSDQSSPISADSEHFGQFASFGCTPLHNSRKSSVASVPGRWGDYRRSPDIHEAHMPIILPDDAFSHPLALTSGQYEGLALQSVGIPTSIQLSPQHTEALSASSVRISQPDYDVDTSYELRSLMLDPDGIFVDPTEGLSRINALVEQYLEQYWARVDPILPIVHRASFDATIHKHPILTAAMAALGAQCATKNPNRSLAVKIHRRCQEALASVSKAE